MKLMDAGTKRKGGSRGESVTFGQNSGDGCGGGDGVSGNGNKSQWHNR